MPELALTPELQQQPPKGGLIHFQNLRAMWRGNPDHLLSVLGYSEDFEIDRRSVRATLRIVAESEGCTLVPALRHNGAYNGYLLVIASDGSQGQTTDYKRHTKGIHLQHQVVPQDQGWPTGPGHVSTGPGTGPRGPLLKSY